MAEENTLGVESAADLAGYFEVNEHAVSATWRPEVGASKSVKGLFDEEFVAVASEASVDIESALPRFTCEAADVAGIRHDDLLEVGAVRYRVRSLQPDGTGVIVLVLELIT